MALKLPTPPTPPTIDKGEATESTPRIDAHQFFEIPFKRETEKPASAETPVETENPKETLPSETVERKVTTPEDMARDAVANGAGALTRREITRPDAESNSEVPRANSNVPVTNSVNDRQSRGKEILREFQNEDREISQSVETSLHVKINQNESYSGFYWIGMMIFAGILSIVFVRKFLVKKNPKLKKSDLFEDADKRLQAVSEKVSEQKLKPVEKNVNKKSPTKNDDDKGKHFEVRI